MAMISALWTRRSTRATTQEALGKASPHSENGRLVVMMVDRFRLRLETMLNSRSAWRLTSLGRAWLTSRLASDGGSISSRSATVMKQFRSPRNQNFAPPVSL